MTHEHVEKSAPARSENSSVLQRAAVYTDGDKGNVETKSLQEPRFYQNFTQVSTHTPKEKATNSVNAENLFAKATESSASQVPFRAEMEQSFGQNFSNVKAHFNQSKHLNLLGASAATKGQEIAFASTHPNKQIVAHELTHVVQNRQAGISHLLQAKSEVSNSNSDAEIEANAVAKQVASGQHVQVFALPSANIQLLQYQDLPINDTRKAQVDAKAENVYYRKAQEFEKKLGNLAANHKDAKDISTKMLARVIQIVDAWAESTISNTLSTKKQQEEKDKIYEKELGWGGVGFGGIRALAKDIKEVIQDKKGDVPMREKLSLVYSAIRNNNLGKWLTLAAKEVARNELAPFHSDQPIEYKTINDKTSLETYQINSGFAQKSGLQDILERNLSKITSTGKSIRDIAREDVVENKKSPLLDWSAEVEKANKSRETVQSPTAHQIKKLKKKDIKDLTERENQKNKQRYKYLGRGKSGGLLHFGLGSQYYRVKVDSELANHARDIKAKLVAGVSGSTDLMMHAGEWLGINDLSDKQSLRLAMLGWMLPANDHSWYEIMKSAEQYGVPFTDPPEGYGDIPPLDQNQYLKPLLPQEHGLEMLPGDYLKDPYKDYLLNNWLSGSGVEVQSNAKSASLIDQGIPRVMIEQLSNEHIDLLTELANDVGKANFVDADNDIKKEQNKNLFEQLKANVNFQKLRDIGKVSTKNGSLSDDPQVYRGLAELYLAVLINNRIIACSSNYKLPAPYSYLAQTGNVLKSNQDMQHGETKLMSDQDLKNLPGNAISWEAKNAKDQYTESKKNYPALVPSTEMENLKDREKAAVYKYTKGGYKGIVPAMINLPLGEKQGFDTSASAALKDNVPQIMALTSALASLPTYVGTVYRATESNLNKQFHSLRAKSYEERETWLQNWVEKNYPAGKILSYRYPLSTAKSFEVITNINTTGTSENDIVFIIEKIKTGKDVQLLSGNPGEEEVLFPPGSRFVIKRYEHSLDIPSKEINPDKRKAPDTDPEKYILNLRARLFIYIEEI